jgi:hypothetical protein
MNVGQVLETHLGWAAKGLGWRIDGTVFPLVNGLWFWTAVIAFFAWVLVQRFGDAESPAPAGAAP